MNITNWKLGLRTEKIHAWAAMVGVAGLGLGLLWSLQTRFGYPEPYIHDEFAYLLGADTFLEGRLTNPTPPEAEFFETFHVSMTPTYHSKYPPGQSVFLALGKTMFGREIYGVWLSYVLAGMAVTWAMFAVFPARWALAGGLIAVVNSDLLMKWAFSFWGGSVAMLGGALFMGGLLRLSQKPAVSAAGWTGLGLTVMAFSRPLEGLLTAGIPLLVFVGRTVRRRFDGTERRELYQAFGMILTFGVLILGFNLLYNKALTGSAFTFPHQHWTPEQSAHTMIQDYQGSPALTSGFKLKRFFTFFIGVYLWVPLLLCLLKGRDWRIWTGFLTVVVVCGYSVFTSRAWPHYVAPVVPMVIGLTIAGFRKIPPWRVGKARVSEILVFFFLIVHLGHEMGSLAVRAPFQINFKSAGRGGATFKRHLDTHFEGLPGKHLILVRYLEGHGSHREYVYNRAELPSADVIWAREMTPEKNQDLFAAYPDRKRWLLKIQNKPVHLVELEDP